MNRVSILFPRSGSRVNLALLLFIMILGFGWPTAAAPAAEWIPMDSGLVTSIFGVAGSGPDNVYAVGSFGKVVHYDGSTWAESPAQTQARLYDVWVSPGGTAFVVGQGGSITRFTAGGGSSMTSGVGVDLNGVWGANANDVFAVGDGGVILHYDGTAWAPMASGVATKLMDVWGTGAGDVYAVGFDGVILHYNGAAWSPMASNVINSLTGVWGSSASDIFATGFSGVILHYDGQAWSKMQSGVRKILMGVWGTAGNDVYVTGWDGVILHYDGSDWTPMNSGVNDNLEGVWGDATGVFAVGAGGVILYHQSSGDRPQAGPTFIVNASDDVDDGVCSTQHCSLREAIAAANAHANGGDPDQILFDLPDDAVIQPSSALPAITDSVSINGTLATGSVALDGSAAGAVDGLVFNTNDSELQGIMIHSFGGHGVVVRGEGNVVVGSYIGTRGFDDLGNGGAGVYLDHGQNNRIGGESAGASNLISGNGGAGVLVDGGSGHVIAGNFIGVDAFGEQALANATGIELANATRCTVGGRSSGARNLISGNTGPGIKITAGGEHSVQGNVIGLNLHGSQALGNNAGIVLLNSSKNFLGGAWPGPGNIVAGNRNNGLRLMGSPNNEIVGNQIGTTLTGAQLGNNGRGILLDGASSNNTIGPDNRIAFNQGAGVQIDGPIHNTITHTLIYANNGRGIENSNGGNTELPPPQLTVVNGEFGEYVEGITTPGGIVEFFGDDGEQGRYFLGAGQADAEGKFSHSGGGLGYMQILATVTDPAGNTSEFSAPASGSSPCADPYESNDDWLQSWDVASGDILRGYICDSKDIDFFKLPAAAVGLGGRVRFRLETAGADLDLVLFRPTFITYDLPLRDISPAQNPATDVPVESLPLQNIPLQNIPLQNIPLQNIPLQNIPLQNIPLQNIPLQNIPLQNIPLQNIPLQNIPLQNIPLQNIPIVDYSVNPVGQDEEVNDRMAFASDAYYLMVIGHNGAYSRRPYTLTVEVEPPPPVLPCTFDPPLSGSPGSLYQPHAQDETQTLILVPQQRLMAMYGAEATAPLITALHAFADMDSAKGVVLPVETDPHVAQAYADWDAHFCDPQRANAVAGRIKGLIYQYTQQMPNLRTVVLIGDDTALPFRRMFDLVETANERDYAAQALLKFDNALYAALRQGYLLSDDFYVDFYPSLYGGWPLYAPDMNIGRMVETPAEITAQFEQYRAQQGKLDATTAAVFGYDFLKDSSQQTADAFERQGLQTEVMNNDDWDATALRNVLLKTRHDLNALNAHFTHFLLAPAAFALAEQGDLFHASEIADSDVNMKGSVNVSIGCHSGLNVCDDCISQLGQSMGADLDFAQAFARKQAVWIGNSGFGYGDDIAVALSEELSNSFVRHLGSQANMSVGEALRRAKRDYALYNMGAYGPYDRKALNVITLYGIPNYQVTVPHPQPASNRDSVSAGPVQDAPDQEGLKSRIFTLSPNLTRVSSERGDYFQAEDGVQAMLYNPLQPRSQFDIALDGQTYPGFTAHGALFLGGDYQDIPDFDPVITMPVTETQRYEPQIIYQDLQPLDTARINHFQNDEGLQEWLTVTPGQFRHQRVDNSDPQNMRVIGNELSYSQMQFEVYYSNSADFTPPIFHQTIARRYDVGNIQKLSFMIALDDADSGVLRVTAICTNGNAWKLVDLAPFGENLWWGSLFAPDEDAFCLMQAVDGAGNVALTAAKGQLYLPETPYRGYWPIVSAP